MSMFYHSDIDSIEVNFQNIADEWRESAVHKESTLHQLSPYIGKMKSSMAKSVQRQLYFPINDN